jgi:protein-tyrosine phosphatase
MVPLADTHVHLFAGRDDGPATVEEAVAMCRMLAAEGVRAAASLSHQNDGYPDNTPDNLRLCHKELAATLKAEKIPLTPYATGEVMAGPELVEKWKAGKSLGVRIIIAHAERYPELLHDPALCDQWIRLGCLIQVTARGLARPTSGSDEAALKYWVKQGMVHLLCSDGHNLDRRPPRIKEGYDVLKRWAGMGAADRIGGIWGNAVLQGLPVVAPPPLKPKRSWFSRLFGS